MSELQQAAARAADALFRFCTPVDVGDPRAFLAAVIGIFMPYPTEVMEAVADPVRGLPSRVKRPDLVDIRRACEEAYAPIERRLERERAIEQQRRLLETPRDPAERPTKEDLLAKHPWLFKRRETEDDLRARGFRPLAEIAAEVGVTQEQIDALPDAPPRRTTMNRLDSSGFIP
jgi:hypothetical protein